MLQDTSLNAPGYYASFQRMLFNKDLRPSLKWSIPFLLELVRGLLDFLPHPRVPLGRPAVVADVTALVLWQGMVGGVGWLGEDLAEQFLERAVEGRRCYIFTKL